MKANYKRLKNGSIGKGTLCFTEKELKQYVDEEWEKKQNEVYKIAVKDVSAQLLAVFFSTLYQPPYKWRKKRLMEFKRNVEFMFQTMTTGVLGRDFTTEHCIEFMKKEFGIDFDEEMKNVVIK